MATPGIPGTVEYKPPVDSDNGFEPIPGERFAPRVFEHPEDTTGRPYTPAEVAEAAGVPGIYKGGAILDPNFGPECEVVYAPINWPAVIYTAFKCSLLVAVYGSIGGAALLLAARWLYALADYLF